MNKFGWRFFNYNFLVDNPNKEQGSQEEKISFTLLEDDLLVLDIPDAQPHWAITLNLRYALLKSLKLDEYYKKFKSLTLPDGHKLVRIWLFKKNYSFKKFFCFCDQTILFIEFWLKKKENWLKCPILPTNKLIYQILIPKW